MGIKIANYKKARATPAAEPTPPEEAPAAPVAAPAPALAPAAPAASAAPRGPTQAEIEAAAARRRRREAEEARRRDAAAQEAPMPQMVPYGDPETAAFMVRQGQALKADPMYRAAKSFEKSIGTSSYRPIEPQQERDLANIQRQTEYDIGVYRKGVARADLLKAIKPDPMLMAKMPKTFKTDRGQQLYEASAKAAALKKLIDAKTLVPSLELDQSMFEQSGMSLEDLNVRLDTITAPSLRPYEGSVPGLMALDPTDMRGRTKTLQNLMTDVVGGAVDPGDSPSMIIPEDQLSRFMSPEQVEAEKIRRQDARIERLRGMPFEDIVAEVQGTSSNSGR